MKKVNFIFVFLFFCAIHAYSQNTIEGLVTSKEGTPLGDATITILKTNNFVSTNDQGKFKLVVPGNIKLPVTIQISRVGFLTKKSTISDFSKKVTLYLDEQDQTLNEVVVIGYGTQKKSDLTGSVVSLNREKLESLPNNNFAQALEGALPGVSVSTNNNNAEGNQMSILIGGRNSITAATRPLIIFDGVPFTGGFSDINPEDIQSIEILKDASAVAIYGSRGSNGVIIITGKSGKKGKMKVNLDISYGTQEIANKPNLLSANDFYSFKSTRNAASITPSEDSIHKASGGTNWYDLASQKGERTSANLSVAGGSDKMTYYLGVSSLNVKGIDVGDEFKRYILRPSLDIKVNNAITVGTNTTLTFLDRSGTPANLNGTNGGQGANTANPLTNPFTSTGQYALYAWPEYHLMGNPMNYTYIWNQDQSNKIFSNNYIKVELPIKGLSYKFNSGIEITSRNTRNTWGRNTTKGYEDNGDGEVFNSLERNFTLENILNYDRTFGKHSINLTGLYSSQSHDYTSDDTKAGGFPNVDMNFSYNLDQSDPTTRKANSTYYKENHVSTMGRLNYGYDSRYLATFTVRRDGYSGFGVDNKYGVFPSGALAWNLLQEKLFKLPLAVSQLKLRGSYGINGNEAVSAYQTQTTLKNTNYIVGSTNTLKVGYIPSTAGNPVLAWESTKKWTVALDYGFFNNRIFGTVEYYNSETGNPGLLLKQQVSPITGYTSVLSNIGKVQNKGLEINFNTKNIDQKNYSWTSNLVMAYNINKILDLYGNGKDDTLNNWFIGHPINVNFDLVYNGIYQNAQDLLNSPIKSPIPILGYIRVKDLNGDSVISTSGDRTIIGQLDPKITMGFTNTFKYKSLSLSVFFQGVYGTTKNNPLQQDNVGTDVVTNTTYKDWWSASNPTGTHWINANGANLAPVPINVYEDASFVRLKDITLSYTLNNSMLKAINKVGFQSLKIYANARNLATFTKYKGLDPELGSSYQLSTPMQKEFSIGINAGF
jgi:TonB-linked SusC/RagA family outer membrane protein